MGATVITNTPPSVFTVVHQSGKVFMAPHMLHELLKYNVLTKIDEVTYSVKDEQEYWKVLSKLD
jgi:hypothetical protein